MFIKPESPALRALFWVLVVLVPGGFLLLALMGADVVHRRLRQDAVAVNDPEAPPSDDTADSDLPETRERPSHSAPVGGAVSDSETPAPLAAA
jgi:hypothetical protein